MPRHNLRPYTGFDIAGIMRHVSTWYFFFFPRRIILYYMSGRLLLLAGLKLLMPAWYVRVNGRLLVTLQLHALLPWHL